MWCLVVQNVYFCIVKTYIMEYGKLKELRKFRKITLKELSSQTGIDRNSLSKIENGKGNPTGDTLDKIVDALNIKIVFTL